MKYASRHRSTAGHHRLVRAAWVWAPGSLAAGGAKRGGSIFTTLDLLTRPESENCVSPTYIPMHYEYLFVEDAG